MLKMLILIWLYVHLMVGSTSKNGTKGNTPTSTGSVSTTATTSTQGAKAINLSIPHWALIRMKNIILIEYISYCFL